MVLLDELPLDLFWRVMDLVKYDPYGSHTDPVGDWFWWTQSHEFRELHGMCRALWRSCDAVRNLVLEHPVRFKPMQNMVFNTWFGTMEPTVRVAMKDGLLTLTSDLVAFRAPTPPPEALGLRKRPRDPDNPTRVTRIRWTQFGAPKRSWKKNNERVPITVEVQVIPGQRIRTVTYAWRGEQRVLRFADARCFFTDGYFNDNPLWAHDECLLLDEDA